MKSRYLTAAIGIPLVLLLVWLGGTAFVVVIAILALLGMRELELACRRASTPLVSVIAYPALLAILFFAWRYASAGDRSHAGAIWLWLLPVALLIAGVLCFGANAKVSLASIALTQLAVFYVGMFSFLLLLRFFPVGDGRLLWLVLIGVWTSDSAAFFAGRAFGRNKLTPLSPGKTKEGFIMGVLITVAVCIGLASAFHFSFRHGLMMGILIAFAAPVGDLIESFWKRELDIKDMGALFPGHGGVLDRCDSLLLASFAVYLYAFWQL